MKKIKLMMLSLLAATTLTFSCKSDDDNTSNESGNFLNVNGEVYVLELGFIEEYGTLADGVFDWDVTLVSEGFIEQEDGTFEGSGQAVYFDLRTENENGLSEGTYVYDNDNGEPQSLTYVVAEASVDIDTSSDSESYISASSGTITITGTGANQVITFDLEGAAGVNISGRYEGILQAF